MRIPNIFIFNPTSDMAIANSNVSYQANKQLVRFQEDLAYLPAVLASQDDVVLVFHYEDLDHIARLYEQGFPTPGQVLQEDVLLENQKVIVDINTFRPWGWAPNIYHRLKQIKTISTQRFWSFSPMEWNNDVRYFYSRAFALDVLKKISERGIYFRRDYFPTILMEVSDLKLYLKKYKRIVLKEPWSSSGRGLMFLCDRDIPINIQQRVQHVIKKQGYIMVEPVLNKKVDFSLHFDLTSEQVNYKGVSYFFTNEKGQYKGHYLNQKEDCEEQEQAFLNLHLPQLIEDVNLVIQQSALFGKYQGVLGIDAMLVEEEGKLCFQPCLEINLRQSMGRVALALEEIIHPKSYGRFFIHNDRNLSYEAFVQQQNLSCQMLDKRLAKGFVPITAPKGKMFGAYMQIGLRV